MADESLPFYPPVQGADSVPMYAPGEIRMTPSRGYTLGETVLGGAQLGARGSSVMGASVRGAGAANKMELERLNLEFMADMARRRARQGLGGVTMGEIGPDLAHHLTEEGRLRGGLGKYFPYADALPGSVASRLNLGDDAYSQMDPVTLKGGSQVFVDNTDLMAPEWLRMQERRLAESPAIRPPQGSGQSLFSVGEAPVSVGASDLPDPRWSLAEDDLDELWRESQALKRAQINPQFSGTPSPRPLPEPPDWGWRGGPVSDIDFPRSGISREVLDLDRPTYWVKQQSDEVTDFAATQRLRAALGDDFADAVWDAEYPAREARPSRLSRLGSGLKAGIKGALTPANIAKDALYGTVVGGLSAGAGHLAGRPTSAGMLSLSPDSALFDEIDSGGSIDQATLLRAIEAAGRKKEALRQSYIDEINARHGEGTVAPGARIEEISDYLGPVRWP